MVLPQLPNYPLTNSPDLRQTALGRERQLAGSEAVNLPAPRATTGTVHAVQGPWAADAPRLPPDSPERRSQALTRWALGGPSYTRPR